MRAKLVSGGWGFLERILKGWEQSHVPKPPSTNINLNIWVQSGLCFFARALGFEFGRFLPVPMSICIFVCQITPYWNSQHCNLCGCNSVQPRGKCQPSAPSAPVQVSSFLPILSPRVTSLFLERESCSMGGRRTCPGACGLSLSHGHGRGFSSTSIPYPGDLLQAEEELAWCSSWEGSVGAQGEVSVKDGVKSPQLGERCKGEATFLFFLVLLEGSSGI